MSRVARWVRGMYLGALVSSLLLFFAGCAFFNQAPTAVITASALSGTSPLVVNFDSSNSTDLDGDVASVDWNFGDGTTSDEAAPHHTFIALTTATTFTVTLRVVDNGGASDEVTQTIEVLPQTGGGGGTGMPIAHITVDHFIGPTALAVRFDATESEAGTGTITQYRWDFGDGATANGVVVNHTYKPDATKEYAATLFVWNSEGDLDTEQVTIIVIVPDAVSTGDDPVADFSMSDPLLLYDSPTPATTPTLYEVSFDPRGSYADAGKSIDYFAWDFGDGETFVETSDLEVTHVYQLASPSRTYVVRLYVYDDEGLQGLMTANLTLSQPVDEE
jgi:large repetitive protein